MFSVSKFLHPSSGMSAARINQMITGKMLKKNITRRTAKNALKHLKPQRWQLQRSKQPPVADTKMWRTEPSCSQMACSMADFINYINLDFKFKCGRRETGLDPQVARIACRFLNVRPIRFYKLMPFRAKISSTARFQLRILQKAEKNSVSSVLISAATDLD